MPEEGGINEIKDVKGEIQPPPELKAIKRVSDTVDSAAEDMSNQQIDAIEVPGIERAQLETMFGIPDIRACIDSDTPPPSAPQGWTRQILEREVHPHDKHLRMHLKPSKDSGDGDVMIRYSDALTNDRKPEEYALFDNETETDHKRVEMHLYPNGKYKIKVQNRDRVGNERFYEITPKSDNEGKWIIAKPIGKNKS